MPALAERSWEKRGVVVLAALMGFTSWVVASISTWLVPVYVTAMVLIFVTPQAQHLGESEPGDPSGLAVSRDERKGPAPRKLAVPAP